MLYTVLYAVHCIHKFRYRTGHAFFASHQGFMWCKKQIRGTFSKLGKELKLGTCWPLKFWAAATLQDNSHLQKHLKVGLIAVHFSCLKVRHPVQVSPRLFLQLTERSCFTCLGCLPCDRMNHSSLEIWQLCCRSYGTGILLSLTVSMSLKMTSGNGNLFSIWESGCYLKPDLS